MTSARWRRILLCGLCLAVAAIVVAGRRGHATPAIESGAMARSPCVLPGADVTSLDLDATRNVSTASWNARPLDGHRAWLAIDETNEGNAIASVNAEVRFDPRPDGTYASMQSGLPDRIAPGASLTRRFSFYVSPGTTAQELRVIRYGAGGRVHVVLRAECSRDLIRPGEMSAAARGLVHEAVDLYDTRALHPPPDPAAFRARAELHASGAADPAELAAAIWQAVAELHDWHSHIFAPQDVDGFLESLRPPEPVVEVSPEGVGVVRLFQAALKTSAESAAYVKRLHDAIEAVAAKHPRAWIVDLRAHQGGDMWVGLAGVSALLEGPRVGSFVSRDGRLDFFARDGLAWNGPAQAPAGAASRAETRYGGPLAVLIGPLTGSAGEALAVAFEGRPQTRFFGAPTRGVSNTGVQAFILSNGTRFGIASSLYADRTGRSYEGPIAPDERLDAHGNDSRPPPEAVAWLLRETAPELR
jgi:hypothetical protein